MSEVLKKPMPKWLAIVVGFLLLAVFSGIVSNCTGGAIEKERARNAATQAAQPREVAEPLPAFKVVKVEDVSVGGTPRFDYRVVVTGQPTPGQLAQVAAAVFNKAKDDQPFSALRIRFYDYPEYADREFTLGVVDYAPDGDWAKAASVEPGDYDSMKATADLPTKDWSKQLTAGEVKVWSAWWDAYDAEAAKIGSDPSKMVDEDAVTKKVAKATGMSADDVQAIIVKQQVWASK